MEQGSVKCLEDFSCGSSVSDLATGKEGKKEDEIGDRRHVH